MTLLYDVAKNYEQFGNPEYVGFAHYRRYLDIKNIDMKPNDILCHE